MRLTDVFWDCKCRWLSVMNQLTRSSLSFWAKNGYVRYFEFASFGWPCEQLVDLLMGHIDYLDMLSWKLCLLDLELSSVCWAPARLVGSFWGGYQSLSQVNNKQFYYAVKFAIHYVIRLRTCVEKNCFKTDLFCCVNKRQTYYRRVTANKRQHSPTITGEG